MDFEELRRKAESGSCVSQSVLGCAYLYGIETEVNYEEAFRWLLAAAKQGASRAVLNLGRMYAEGLGAARNMPEAIRHFEAVARPSSSSDAFAARIELARIYARGKGVEVDAEKAVKWYSAATEIANPEIHVEELQEAQEYLGTHGA